MSLTDRALLLQNEAEIARRAASQGFDLRQDGWMDVQVDCPAFPEHLILKYSRSLGDDEVSLFSAVLTRSHSAQSAPVRILPAQRRGDSLFTPASTNANTIQAFNEIVKEEGQGSRDRDWLTTGLCYAALASGDVPAALVPADAARDTFPAAMPAIVHVGNLRKNGAEVDFEDARPDTKALEWRLTFDASGQIVKVRRKHSREYHSGSGKVEEHGPLRGAVDAKGKPVPGSVVEADASSAASTSAAQ